MSTIIKRGKSVLALLMALCLCAVLLVFTQSLAKAADPAIEITDTTQDGSLATGAMWDATEKKLTLTNYVGGSIVFDGIYGITVILSGTSTITADAGYDGINAAYITVTGTGTLNIINNNDDKSGIRSVAGGTLTISGVTIDITAAGDGIYSGSTLDISDATIGIDASAGDGIHAVWDMKISDSAIDIDAAGDGIYCGRSNSDSPTVNGFAITESELNVTAARPINLAYGYAGRYVTYTANNGTDLTLKLKYPSDYYSPYVYYTRYDFVLGAFDIENFGGTLALLTCDDDNITEEILQDGEYVVLPDFLTHTDERYPDDYTEDNLGDEEHPFIIDTAEELQQLGIFGDILSDEYPEAYIKLNNTEYNLSGGWRTFGISNMHIDGNGAEIIGLDIEDSDFMGLFRNLDSVDISNLTLVSPVVKSDGGDAGALAASASNSVISNVRVIDGTIYTEGESGGGLLGIANNTVISNVRVSGNISAGANAGGLIGEAYDETDIVNSGMTGGSVLTLGIQKVGEGGGRTAGGIAGRLTYSRIRSCYSYADVSADEMYYGGGYGINVGGVVGIMDGRQGNSLFNTYSVGNVSAKENTGNSYVAVGGIAGRLQDNAVNNYFGGTIAGPENDKTYIGQLFGIVIDDDGNGSEFKIAQNYHIGNGIGYNTAESSDGRNIDDDSVAPETGTYAEKKASGELLAALNAGTEYLRSSKLDENALTWTIDGTAYFVPKSGNPVHGEGGGNGGGGSPTVEEKPEEKVEEKEEEKAEETQETTPEKPPVIAANPEPRPAADARPPAPEVEVNEDGTPSGEWVWNEELGEWEFVEFPVTQGGLATGDGNAIALSGLLALAAAGGILILTKKRRIV